MNVFPKHTTQTAPDDSRPMLEKAEQSLGFLPNLYAHLAEAPAVLEAYFSLSAQFEKTSLTASERQIVLLAASVENGCEFCVAAHSMIGVKMAEVSADAVEALRVGAKLADPRQDALASFSRALVKDRGWVTDPERTRFFAAGFAPQQALEVVLGIAMKTLSNYANHLTGTQTNPELAAFDWKRPA